MQIHTQKLAGQISHLYLGGFGIWALTIFSLNVGEGGGDLDSSGEGFRIGEEGDVEVGEGSGRDCWVPDPEGFGKSSVGDSSSISLSSSVDSVAWMISGFCVFCESRSKKSRCKENSYFSMY